ncbi:putative transcription factor GRAS family [Helianthus anomalus]
MQVYETFDHELFSALATTPENSSVNFPVLSNDSGHVTIQTGIMKLLMMAYAEAVEMEQEELAKVIAKCISQKANLNGSPLERIALNLFPPEENQEKTYLFQESLTNFNTAFRAFYDIFPYGRFAHLTAGSAIIEAVPAHVNLVHIVDFDICEGIQWPPFIEAIARIKKSVIITSIKLDQDSQFDQTRWQLCNFATSLGLNLKVQEMGMAQMVKKMDTRKLGSEFMVFNCMIGLLHMGRTRKTTQVMDFLKIARGLLAKHQGIITFGGGLEVDRTTNYSDFSLFFNKNLAHYEALFESMEWGFPSYLNEARIAMETLFLAPFVSSKSWFEKWDEQRQEKDVNFEKGFGLKGERMSMENCNEAMEMVKEGETPYRIRIEGENGNEMVLAWKETSLVRVCVWKVMTEICKKKLNQHVNVKHVLNHVERGCGLLALSGQGL